MAKKRKSFDFATYMDQDAINSIMSKGGSIAPTKEEIEILKKTSGEVVEIPVSSLVDYHNHTFKVLDDEDMDSLVDSIKINGIIMPLTVRESADGKYEIISGHRRAHAAAILGLKTLPCIVLDIDDATADIMMVDTNIHRSTILPSEKARSYDLRIRAMRAKGIETDDIESDNQYEEMLAKDINSSKINVYRYRKLAKLIPEILDLVDAKEISVNAGVKIAAISKKQQRVILEALKTATNPLSMDAAGKIVTAARNDLTVEKVIAILDGDFKPRKKKTSSASNAIKEKNIKGFYPASIKSLSGTDKESFIGDCIKAYLETHDSWNGHTIK